MNELGKVLLPQAPRPANDFGEYRLNVERYAREVEQTFRQFERWAHEFDAAVARKADLEGLGGGVNEVTTEQVVEQGTQGPPGRPGSPGQPGSPGAVWRHGVAQPPNTLGANGDFLLDSVLPGGIGDVWARTAGTYALLRNVRGPQGTQGSDGSSGLHYGARIYASALEFGGVGLGGAVPLNRAAYDTDALFGFTGELDIQRPGYYLVAAQVSWGTLAGVFRASGVRMNGSAWLTLASQYFPFASGLSFVQNTSAFVYLPAGTFLALECVSTSAGSDQITGGPDNTWLSAHWIEA